MSYWDLLHRYLFAVLWLCWAAYWWLRSHDVKATARRESTQQRLLHIAPLAVAVLLFWQTLIPIPFLYVRFVPFSEAIFVAGAALTLAGLLFTVWARIHIGRNWSGVVTVKENHELVTSGPYAIVRHPIYSGLLLGFAGSALALGEVRGLVAVALALWSFQRRIGTEERWMREQFGAAYQAYGERVARLVPFLY